jgi:uncharacterized protein (TIGR03643 family)
VFRQISGDDVSTLQVVQYTQARLIMRMASFEISGENSASAAQARWTTHTPPLRRFFSWSNTVADSFSERLSSLSAGDISAIIQMAWEDRTSFETIEERTGWAEADVIRLMRHELRPQSFRLWRQRMQGRVTKHRALRSPEMKFHDRQVADHRRPNC